MVGEEPSFEALRILILNSENYKKKTNDIKNAAIDIRFLFCLEVYKEYGAKRKWGGTHFFVWDKSEHFFTFVSKKIKKRRMEFFFIAKG